MRTALPHSLRPALPLCLALLLLPSYSAGPAAAPPAPQNLADSILHAQGLDAVQWGEDTPNPFANLTAEQIAAFKAHNVDIPRLQKMRAVLIMGNYCGANSRTFVNRDPNVILVLGDGPPKTIKHLVFANLAPATTPPTPAKIPATSPAPEIATAPPDPSPPAETPAAPALSPDQPQAPRIADIDPSELPPAAPATAPASRPAVESLPLPAPAPERTARSSPRPPAALPPNKADPANYADGPLEEKPYDHNFSTHADVYSLGPVVSTLYANHMREFKIVSADVAWFQVKDLALTEPRFAEGLSGAPLVFSTPPRKNENADLIVTESSGPQPFTFSDPAQPTRRGRSPRAANPRTPRTEPQVDVATFGIPTPNPFTHITPAGLAKLKARGIDVPSLTKMKAVLVSGKFTGADTLNFDNHNANLILIIGNDFITHGTIHSAGPILATGDANFMNSITGDSLVWFVNKSFPRGPTTGKPIIMAPHAIFSQTQFTTTETWHGDYGWRLPEKP